MPEIRPSTDLRNHYNEISEFCRSSQKPVFITRNGRADVTILSTEEYDRITERAMLADLLTGNNSRFCTFDATGPHAISQDDLSSALDIALAQAQGGEGIPIEDAFAEIRRRLTL